MFRKWFVLVISACAVAGAASMPAVAAPSSLSDANSFHSSASMQGSKALPVRRYAQSSSDGSCKDETGKSVPCSGSTGQGAQDPNGVGTGPAVFAAVAALTVVVVAVNSGSGERRSVSLP